MVLSPLPKYPASQRSSFAAGLPSGCQRLSPRATRTLLDLVWLMLIAVVLWEFRPITKAIEHPSPPLDFGLIKERYELLLVQERWVSTREEAEMLFGPPMEHDVWDPELKEKERILENLGRNPMPELSDRFWDRWSDPADNGRWVALLYNGYSKSAKVYGMFKRGF